MTALEILKKYWGYDSFRRQQGDIVESVLNGHDTFALLPTGGGKSICFQVPGIAREGNCIVISPLIALMQDQVKNLNEKGIRAASINSGMSRREIDIALDNAKNGGYDFLYVSPERLKTEIFIQRFKQMRVALIAIDEAHCISQWGHDFRPPYLEIYKLREIHPNVPMIAVTATATEKVKQDIIEYLQLHEPNYFEDSFARENISYEIYPVENKLKAILGACKKFSNFTGIIYCQTRRETKEVARFLLVNGYSAGVYHGGLNSDDRKQKLEAWMQNRIRIMVATNAFGMGIDKPDVRFVLHYELPNNIEAYFQEAGRSGRDGKNSRNLAFYTKEDISKMKQQLANEFPPLDFVKLVYRALCNHFSIAIGSGINENYGLDLKEFVQKYNFDSVPAYNALKILEMNGSLLFSESFFSPTTAKFMVSNTAVYNFQVKNPKYDALVSLLSRKYPGIFSGYRKIDERKIGEILKISKKQVIQDLKYLEKQGLVDFTWQTELPQVTLLHERLPDDYMSIDKEIYEVRKQVAYDKLEAMLNFMEEPTCRSILLLRYFGQEGERCGKCDVCLSEEKSNYSSEELIEIIKSLVEQKAFSFNNILEELGEKNKSRLTGILNWMVDEKIIEYESGLFKRME